MNAGRRLTGRPDLDLRFDLAEKTATTRRQMLRICNKLVILDSCRSGRTWFSKPISPIHRFTALIRCIWISTNYC